MVEEDLVNRLDEETIHDMFIEAVDIENEFINESISCEMIGMNKTLMFQYIQFVADRLLVCMGYTKLYMVNCPFHFMENISMIGKTNFFERKNSDYMISTDSSSSKISFLNDF
jgi:ribonucleotide reductase beta subunit family protein with ferritin-like domain